MQVETMTLEEIFDEMARLKLSYRVSSLNSYKYSVWVEVSGSHDGVEIKSEKTVEIKDGVRVSDVVRECFAKWHRSVNRGVTGILAAPIEATALPPSRSDDIPF